MARNMYTIHSVTVQKQIYRLLIALFPYIAMTTKQRICNGTLKVKINLHFFVTVCCRSAATKARHIFIDCLRQFVGVCCAKVLEEL